MPRFSIRNPYFNIVVSLALLIICVARSSVLLTIFIGPAAYLLVYGRKTKTAEALPAQPQE